MPPLHTNFKPQMYIKITVVFKKNALFENTSKNGLGSPIYAYPGSQKP